MDAAITNKTGRTFPSYTTKELKETVAKFDAGEFTFSTAETIAKIRLEIANREAGISKHLVIPQNNSPMVIRRTII